MKKFYQRSADSVVDEGTRKAKRALYFVYEEAERFIFEKMEMTTFDETGNATGELVIELSDEESVNARHRRLSVEKMVKKYIKFLEESADPGSTMDQELRKGIVLSLQRCLKAAEASLKRLTK